MAKSKAAEDRGYHHGNLREALLAEAINIIQAEDVAAVSLRKLARQLGVTNAAPYHHFKDKSALLSAVAAEGFLTLVERGQRAMAAHVDPFDRLHALGLAYVSIAIEHPAHYILMFDGGLHDTEHEALLANSAEAFGMLVEAIQHAQTHLNGTGDITPAVLSTWSMVHGYASLWTQGVIPNKTGLEDWMPMAGSMLRMLNTMLRQQLKQRADETG